MAEIVSAVHGLRGSLYSSIAFAKRIAARGHRVTFVGFRDVSADVRAAGFDWVRLEDGPAMEASLQQRRAEVGTVRSIPVARRLRRAMLLSSEVGDTFDRLDPDLVIVDSEMHGVILPALSRGLPMLLVVPWSSPFRASGLPPMHTSLRPPTSWRERLVVRAEWEWLFARRVVDRTIGRARPRALRRRLVPFQLNSPSITDVRALARSHGLRLRTVSTMRQWQAPVMYPSLPHLSMTAAAFDFPHDRPPELHYAGPMIDVHRAEPLVSADARRQWHDFRDQMAAQNRRIVYASMGSLQPGNAAFYRRIIDTVRSRNDLAAVMGLGSRASRSDLGALPDNALALGYAPQLEVLASAWVAIHHGGIGTINECVHFGVPSVAASSGFVDEPGTVARLDHHQLGVEVSMSDLMGSPLGGLIDHVGAESSIRNGLRVMRSAFEDATAAERGEQLVDELATPQHPWSPPAAPQC